MGPQGKSALSQIVAVLVKNMSLFSYGMIKGFPAILIGANINKNKNSTDFSNMSNAEMSWIGSISYMMSIIGSLLTALVTQPLGRKRSMQLTSIPFVLCWIVLYFSSEIWHVLLMLSIMGLFAGLLEAPFMVFVAEISEPYLRGILMSTSPFFIMLGVAMQYALGNFFHWRTCTLISCAPPILSFILFCFIPESPYWLLLNNKLIQAKKSLAWLRGWTSINEIESEIQEMIKDNLNVNVVGKKKNFDLTPFLKRNFIFPLGILAVGCAMGYFSGVAALETYSVIIFQNLNVPVESYKATVFLGISQVFGIVITTGSVYFLGRRKLLFTSILGVFTCNIILAIYVNITNCKYLITSSDGSAHDFGSFGFIPLLTLLAMSFNHYCGMHTLPFGMMGEIFPYETRSVGCGLAGAIGGLFLFVSKKVYLDIVSTTTLFYSYLLQSIFAFVGFLFMYFALPETEGKSLNEIKNHFMGVSKLDKKVKRRQHTEHV